MDKKRAYGQHLTPVAIFKKYILPEIKNNIYKYKWVDLFAGEGNLILPILEIIPKKERINFFKKHFFSLMFLYLLILISIAMSLYNSISMLSGLSTPATVEN